MDTETTPTQQTPPTVDPTPEPAPIQAALPPAAEIVQNGTKTEREVELETTLQKERDARKRVEMRAAQLEDENRSLKTIPGPNPSAVKKSFLDGATFFGSN